MGSRRSKKRKQTADLDRSFVPIATDQGASPQRVMSISPTDIDPVAEPVTIDHGDVLLTPRVLDQNAFDKLSETLRGLIGQANGISEQIRDEFNQATEAKGQASKASEGLHERLRVSARMLKAFQSQIDLVQERITQLTTARKEAQAASDNLNDLAEKFETRVADAAAIFEDQIDETLQARLKRFDKQLTEREQATADMSDRIARAETRVNELVAQTERRVESVVERAEGKVQPIVADAKQQAESLLADVRGSIETVAGNAKDSISGLMNGAQGRIEAMQADTKKHAKATVAEAQRSVDALVKVVEGAEINAADAAMKSAKATQKIDKSAADTSQIIGQVKHARRLLGEHLLQATEQVDQLSNKGDKICRAVRTGQDELESAARRLAQTVASVHDADEKRKQLDQTCQTLVPLLEQLKPWESLFQSTAGEQTVGAHPIVQLLDEMRSGLGEDAARLTGSMRHMAARLDDLLRLNQGKAAVMIEPRDAKAQMPQITTTVKDPPKPAAKPTHAQGH